MEANFSAEIEELPKILQWIRTQLEKTELPDREKKRMEIAMEEAIVNVINHAKSSSLSIYFKHEPSHAIEFQVKDTGPPFNPLDVIQTVQNEWELEDREPGGLGLTIIRNYMDVLLYRREADQNILILIKKISW